MDPMASGINSPVNHFQQQGDNYEVPPAHPSLFQDFDFRGGPTVPHPSLLMRTNTGPMPTSTGEYHQISNAFS